MSTVRFSLVLFVLSCCLSVSAQQATSPYDPATAPHVVKVTGIQPGGAAGLGDRVVVSVRNFSKLLDQASANCHGIVLFVDALPLRGMPPESCNPYDGTVRYLLDRVPDQNDAEWHRLLGSPNGFTRKVRVSVGANDQFAVPTDVTAFPLAVIPPMAFYLFLILLFFSLLLFIHLCRTTSIIRAPVPPAGGGQRPYSLSRFQMAFWFFLVITGYVMVWMITGELDTITDSILALIGIGAGTSLGAALIDSAPAAAAPVAPGQSAPPPLPVPPPAPTQGFLSDVLSDSSEGGISIHRFQMFAWTLILGVIFVSSVYAGLAMPEFNATLLGLMGISSGTYLGFKFPEKKRADAAGTSARAG